MLVPIYYYDEEKFFVSEGIAQKIGEEVLLPNDATQVEPGTDPDQFYKWNGEGWDGFAKPKTAEDFLNLRVSHTSQTPHNIELRALLQAFAEQSSEYRIIRGSEDEGLWWGIEVIPPKSEKELKEERIAELKGKLSSTDYIVAKIAEGVSTKDDYAQTLEDRKGWRAEINRLEAEIAELQ